MIDVLGSRSQLVACGRLNVAEGEFPVRLLAIYQGLQAVIQEHQPLEAAVEETFINRSNAQSALVLGQARGAAICALAVAGLPVAEYAAPQVKLAIAGSGRAEKEQIQHMVKILLKTQVRLAADAADALAVALTHAHVRQTQQRTGTTLLRQWGRR